MKVGLMFGCFDLFHIGHLRYIQQARENCDELVVVAADNGFIEIIKKRKPIFDLEYRMDILAAINGVDEIDWYGKERSKEEVLRLYKPDILFYNDTANNKKKYQELGKIFKCELLELEYTKTISTTKIINKIWKTRTK